MFVGGASEASGTKYSDTNTYQYQNICLAVERQLNKCTLHADNGSKLCHTVCIQMRQTHMRKIERQMCDAIRNTTDWKSGNTRVTNFYNDNNELVVTSVFLHDNMIAEVTDTDVTLYDGGWQSNTTKSRLNAICNTFCVDGEGIFQKNFKWFVHKFVGQAGTSKVYNVEPFVNGYTFA